MMSVSGSHCTWMEQTINLILSLCLITARAHAADCDYTIRSGPDLPKNGTFTSPNFPEHYNNSLRCYYRFVAMENERVQLRFLDFDVKGVPPRCVHDYIDIYSQMHDPQAELLDVPLHGRYCGNDPDVLPHLVISMYNVLVVGFYTDEDRTEKGFKAEYSFIDGTVYTVGAPAPAHVCGQTIDGTVTPTGILLSPTYPGMYPDNIFCYYKLQGSPGQRIRFTFLDLDLFSGGHHCPFDYVKIYDGFTNEDQVIGTYCGKLSEFDLYSTKEALHIEFVTKSGRVEPTDPPYVPYWVQDTKIRRKGFRARFTISSDFINLNFIKEGFHVRGSECDQQVLSTGESNGTISSPGYPMAYKMNRTCHFYIDGMVNRQNLEKARLTFDDFDMPMIDDKCIAGNITAYLRGQDMMRDKEDQQFCGPPPDFLITDDPRMLLVFDTHGNGPPGRGFKANYQFVTDYAIPGTPASDSMCHFLYYAESKREGTFNSPRHPSNYPLNTECIYEFHGKEDQIVKIDFENFNVEHGHPGNCTTDYLELYNIVKVRGVTTKQELAGRYCGSSIPGPMVSWSQTVRVKLVTDGVYSTEHGSSGFRAKYEFVDKKPLTKRCFSNATSGGGGLIKSPNYPHKYLTGEVCEHHVYAKHPGGRIIIQFASFAMEGNLDGQGCPLAVLKIYTNHSGWPQYELCGPRPKEQFILSQGNYIRLQFISSKNGVGGKGFKITWTEIMPEPDDYCGGYKCKINKYCIDAKLKCNHLPNCGPDDTSDETDQCGPSYTDHGVLHIILGVVIALIVLVFLIVCILHRRRKMKKKKNKKEIEVRYVTRSAYSGGGGGSRQSMDGIDGRATLHSHKNHDPRINELPEHRTLLKERTEKVSIV